MEKRQYGNTTVNLRNPARFDTARSDDNRHRATPSDSQQTNIRKTDSQPAKTDCNRHHATPSDSQHTNIRKSDIQPAKSDCTCYGATPNVGTYYRHFHRMPSTLTDLSHRIHQPPTNAKTLGARPEEPDRAPSAMKGRKGESKKE
ncbi:hypothetical protein [Bifidobacterium sp. UTBIF-78]|uniref:hypothetical protein n=1 Tax=Bifidobacterium sp. UTBIF-78 TaxID=1465263 RepID=UPI00112EA0DD|nr:hypothetical protein [Bifidobacterium sp. UTBIF-78]